MIVSSYNFSFYRNKSIKNFNEVQRKINLQRKNNLGFWMNLILFLHHYWSYFHQTLCNLCINFVLEEPLIFVILNWLLLIYENLIFQFLIYMLFLKYAFLFVMIRSMEEGDPLKQVGFFIRCSKLKDSKKLQVFVFRGHIEIS